MTESIKCEQEDCPICKPKEAKQDVSFIRFAPQINITLTNLTDEDKSFIHNELNNMMNQLHSWAERHRVDDR